MQSLAHIFEAKAVIYTTYMNSLAVCVFCSAQAGCGLQNLTLLSADCELKTILISIVGGTS